MSASYPAPLNTTQSSNPHALAVSSPPQPPNGHAQSMDARQSDYQQPDQASAAAAAVAHQYPQSADPRSSTFPASETSSSEYGITPSSARSAGFPDYMSRHGYTQPGAQSTHSGDPSVASTTSPTYPQPQYSPYAPSHDMSHYQGHPSAPPMYGRPPEWGHFPGHGVHPSYPHSAGPAAAPMVSPVARPPGGGHVSQIYSFVPIPGAQQHKRPRRRYEEIERMYKCGWQGCEKAYGTLNHLNAHVTMQSHGSKRTPEEFKEIRKEWKAKKKEEEAARKAEEERQRQADGRHDGAAPQTPSYGGGMRPGMQQHIPGTQLPPIGFGPSPTAPPGQYPPQNPGLDGLSQQQ